MPAPDGRYSADDIPCPQPVILRCTLRYGALAIAALLAATVPFTMFVYRSIDIFTPPERLESLSKSYQLSDLPTSQEKRPGLRRLWLTPFR